MGNAGDLIVIKLMKGDGRAKDKRNLEFRWLEERTPANGQYLGFLAKIHPSPQP